MAKSNEVRCDIRDSPGTIKRERSHIQERRKIIGEPVVNRRLFHSKRMCRCLIFHLKIKKTGINENLGL
jgi:hypothetical protein